MECGSYQHLLIGVNNSHWKLLAPVGSSVADPAIFCLSTPVGAGGRQTQSIITTACIIRYHIPFIRYNFNDHKSNIRKFSLLTGCCYHPGYTL